jgi:hypothetical protein
VWTVSGGGCEERKRNTNTCSADRVWRPLQGEERKERKEKVTATIRTLAAQTVSGGGCEERIKY